MSIEAISYGASQIDHFFIFGILQNGESDLVEELVLRVGQTIQPMTMRCEHSGKPLQPGFHSCLCRPAARLSANTGNNDTIGAPTAANTARLARVGKVVQREWDLPFSTLRSTLPFGITDKALLLFALHANPHVAQSRVALVRIIHLLEILFLREAVGLQFG